ncbi:hypothetical protein BJX66DRAFT_305870 [Aspergillus keveii]|uniref:Uncharacterized protein n=1 Tax=Aspergillus keveii TaxID=714993 RepID=A0ABR4G3I8_9EURO
MNEARMQITTLGADHDQSARQKQPPSFPSETVAREHDSRWDLGLLIDPAPGDYACSKRLVSLQPATRSEIDETTMTTSSAHVSLSLSLSSSSSSHDSRLHVSLECLESLAIHTVRLDRLAPLGNADNIDSTQMSNLISTLSYPDDRLCACSPARSLARWLDRSIARLAIIGYDSTSSRPALALAHAHATHPCI